MNARGWAYGDSRAGIWALTRGNMNACERGQFPDFGEGLHNGDGGLRGLGAFQDGGKHVQVFFGEGFGQVFRMFSSSCQF